MILSGPFAPPTALARRPGHTQHPGAAVPTATVAGYPFPAGRISRIGKKTGGISRDSQSRPSSPAASPARYDLSHHTVRQVRRQGDRGPKPAGRLAGGPLAFVVGLLQQLAPSQAQQRKFRFAAIRGELVFSPDGGAKRLVECADDDTSPAGVRAICGEASASLHAQFEQRDRFGMAPPHHDHLLSVLSIHGDDFGFASRARHLGQC